MVRDQQQLAQEVEACVATMLEKVAGPVGPGKAILGIQGAIQARRGLAVAPAVNKIKQGKRAATAAAATAAAPAAAPVTAKVAPKAPGLWQDVKAVGKRAWAEHPLATAGIGAAAAFGAGHMLASHR